MAKYYEAYDKRYLQVHEKSLSWASDKSSPIVLNTLQKYVKSDHAKILDIGCGEGRDCLFLLDLGYDVQAIDISKEAIYYCKNKADNFSYIPDCSDLEISQDSDYVYMCENNTIYGTKFKVCPNSKGRVLLNDISSCFLSEPMNVSNYGMLFGGVQKNLAPAGLVIAIMHKDLISETVLPNTPTMLQYKIHADKKSLYNTPPTYNIYMVGKVLKWIQSLGGLEKMREINERKAAILWFFRTFSYTPDFM